LLVALLLPPQPAFAQRTAGEIRIEVRDDAGGRLDANATIESEALRVRRVVAIDESGSHVASDLPFGIYRLEIARPGYRTYSTLVEVRTGLPLVVAVTLTLEPFQTAVTVTADAAATILDPHRGAAVNYIGLDLIGDRPASAAGRSLIDLVNTQPGWLLEANGILHPRGSEYQVQYVVDGIPLRDNRSPAFAQSLVADDVESMTVRTAGYPAEFGGKLGAVIEVSTARDTREGLHGVGSIEGGSFDSLNGIFAGQYSKRGTSGGFSVERMTTDRYLDPPNEGNFTNHGRVTGLSGRLERDWNESSRTRASLYRRASRFEVPNEALQQEAGQLQRRTAEESLVQAAHQHVLGPSVLVNARLMARDGEATLVSNERSIPIRPAQDRQVREVHANGSVSVHRGRHEIKIGGDTTSATLDEAFSTQITARSLLGVRIFDRDIPERFAFEDRAVRREHGLFAQDLARLGDVTLSAGVRYDRYRLRESEQAWSPRLSGSWYSAPLDLVLHASYDRTFETPPIENILLASANVVEELGGEGEILALESSRGHFAEIGFSKRLLNRVRLDGTAFSRRSTNMVDDDLLLNTGVSIPLTFSRAVVKGIEGKLDIVRWGRASGSISYSNSVGTGYLPFAGGLFLGDDVDELLEGEGPFRLTQDQRHTARGRVRVDLTPRVWAAAAGRYDSGLPIELEGVDDDALLRQQYGDAVVDQVDEEHGRVQPSWSLDASAGMTLFRRAGTFARLQLDVFNITDRLNVINFAGLLSGTAIAPRRSVSVRLHAGF
jgi:hypothetical protein